jgi:DNA-binding NtrC family response regulator
MMVFCRRNTISIDDLPPRLFLNEGLEQRKSRGKVQLVRMVSELEKKWIVSKLEESDWNQEKASRLLGITRKMLANRINKYNIKPQKNRRPDFKTWQ